MKRAILLGIAFLLAAASAQADALDTILSGYDFGPMWNEGTYPVIHLPPSASTEQVVAMAFAETNFTGKGKDYRILETRKVRIPGTLPDRYTAVLIRTGHQGAVFLLQNQKRDWWSWVIAVAPDKMPR
jgi:hypothetical protein